MRIGLTGGIASGKSTVADLLREWGVEVIDADKIAHQLIDANSQLQQQIGDEFGTEIRLSNGQIDRKQLGEVVFANDHLRQKLEEIIHPFIIAQIKEEMEQIATDKLVVVEVPLLIEAEMMDLFDRIWLVYITQELQVKRLMARENFSYQSALQRINSQMPLDEKKKYADRIITNQGSREELQQKVKESWQQVRAQITV
ncbi:dephospho-CoA kinase [Halanaerobaculum tunisiense]